MRLLQRFLFSRGAPMVDNVESASGSGGPTFATDDISSVHYPRVKVTWGPDGTANDTDGASGKGLPIQGEAAHDAATTGNPVLVGGEFDDTTPDAVDEGDVGRLRISTRRELYIQIRDAAGNERGVNVDASNNLKAILAANSGVDIGDVDILSVTPGTGASNLGKAEDAAHTSGDVGVMALAVRRNADTSLVGTDGDYAPLQVDANGALKVEIFDGGGSHTVDNAGTFAVQVSSALPAGTNAIGKLAANSGIDIGDVDVLSIAAGSNLIGDVGISGARTSGGTTIFRSLDLDETEEEIKGSAGQVYWIHAMNLASGVRYLKFYNATAATVVVGTTTPVLTFPLPTQGDTNGAGFTLNIPNGIAFGTAITVAATTGVADNDTGAPGANEVVVNIGYA